MKLTFVSAKYDHRPSANYGITTLVLQLHTTTVTTLVLQLHTTTVTTLVLQLHTTTVTTLVLQLHTTTVTPLVLQLHTTTVTTLVLQLHTTTVVWMHPDYYKLIQSPLENSIFKALKNNTLCRCCINIQRWFSHPQVLCTCWPCNFLPQ